MDGTMSHYQAVAAKQAEEPEAVVLRIRKFLILVTRERTRDLRMFHFKPQDILTIRIHYETILAFITPPGKSIEMLD